MNYRRRTYLIILFVFLLASCSYIRKIPDIFPRRTFRLDTIPPRSAEAISGSEFARQTASMSEADRQRAAVAELQQGNIPEFLRNLKPVKLSGTLSDGDTVSVLLWVLPDYLAIGLDEDFLRIPLSYGSATTIANTFNCVLPTPKMVDAIYAQSTVRLKPQLLSPGSQMRTNAYALKHQNMIETQRAGHPLGALTAGHKKDVVLTNLLHRRSNRIAIYGWHWSLGNPIQPLSIRHGATYADYSHGVRLVYQTVWFDGKPRSILNVLQDPELGPVLTYESVITDPYSLMRRK